MVKKLTVASAAASPATDSSKISGGSFAAKIARLPGEYLKEGHGVIKVNGIHHLQMDPKTGIWILCARCNTICEPGSFESHMKEGKCLAKKDRSAVSHNLAEEGGDETTTFWKGIWDQEDRSEFGDKQGIWLAQRGSKMCYMVYPEIGVLKVLCNDCGKSLSLNKAKHHNNKAHQDFTYKPIKKLRVVNAGKSRFLFVQPFCDK